MMRAKPLHMDFSLEFTGTLVLQWTPVTWFGVCSVTEPNPLQTHLQKGAGSITGLNLTLFFDFQECDHDVPLYDIGLSECDPIF